MDIFNSNTFKHRTIFRIENLSGAIKDRLLWNPTSFNIYGGDKLAITGSNGVGKTTLIKNC